MTTHPSSSRATQTPEHLPPFSHLADPSWGLDLEGLAEDLFSGSHQGLRREAGAGGGVVAYRNSDLKALGAHPALSNQPPEINARPFYEPGSTEPPGFQRLMRNSLFTMQPPAHTTARGLVQRHLTAKGIGHLAPFAAELAETLVTQAAEQEDVDFVTAVAYPMMVGFWSRALGLPGEDVDRICRLATRVQASNDLRPTTEVVADVNLSSDDLLEALTSALGTVIDRGDNPLFAGLVERHAALGAAERPEPLEAVYGVALLEGLHSLSGEIASVVHALLGAPQALARVRADPSRVPDAFHEGTRLHPAVILTNRHAMADFEHDGVRIPCGTAVTMLWFFGNRDPDAFTNPNAYELDRPNRRHLTFGGGFYICPGRNVVRLLAESVLAAVTGPSVDVVPAGEVSWVPRSALHELERLPVAISRR